MGMDLQETCDDCLVLPACSTQSLALLGIQNDVDDLLLLGSAQ